jgi:hypothetical protein
MSPRESLGDDIYVQLGVGDSVMTVRGTWVTPSVSKALTGSCYFMIKGDGLNGKSLT